MFVGHYAAALALKGKEKNTSLGWLFIAVQFVDILFFPFALSGIESMEFVTGFTETNDFKMEFPFTHSLLGSVIWAVLFGGIFYLMGKKKGSDSKKVAIVLGLGVLSHWFSDLFVHTPDLPLIYEEPKFGFGLWESKLVTFLLEAVLLAVALLYYLKRTTSKTQSGKYAAIGLVIFLVLVNYLNYYVLPANNDLMALTISALLSFLVLAGLAFWVDGKRV